MKIIRTFCLGKQILLQDPQKLSKYLKLVYQTPISYQGVVQSIGYKDILNQAFNYESFQSDQYSSIIKLMRRDIRQLNISEYSSFLQSINNYLYQCKSEYPQNEQVFQDALHAIIDEGSPLQKLMALQHIVIYYDSKITQYSQLAQQLKDFYRDYYPKQIEETIYKLYWELLDSYDQQRIDILISKQSEYIDNSLSITHLITKDYLQMLDNIIIDIKNFNLLTQLIVYEFNIRMLSFPNIELSEKQQQLIFITISKCQETIDRNLHQLNGFQLLYYTHLLSLNTADISVLNWELVAQEIMSRDLSIFSTQDIIKLMLNLNESKKVQQPVLDRLVERLYNTMNLIPEKEYANVVVVVTQIPNQYVERFIKRLYPKLNLNNLSGNDLGVMMGALQNVKLMNSIIFNKFIAAIEIKVDTMTDSALEGVLECLFEYKLENKIIFTKCCQLELSQTTDINFLLNLLKYCQWFDPKNSKVDETQKMIALHLKENYDKDIVLSFIQILATINGDNKSVINVNKQMKQYVIKLLNDEKQLMGDKLQQISNMLLQVYSIK